MTTSQRIIYTSFRRTTGLSDITITIKNANNSVVVNAASMTELGNGDYYYDYVPTSAGWHTWYADSTGTTSPQSGSFLSDYSTTTTVTSTSSDIATTQELARYLNIEGVVPDRTIVGESRTRENIGTGDSSTTEFYTDYSGILDGTYTISYGYTESSRSTLTETTDYSIDKDLGKITLTASAVSGIATATIYGEYSYVKLSHGMTLTDTQLQTALDLAQNEVESTTNTVFVDGTAATPGYTKITNELHSGQGNFNRDYFLDNYPIPDVSTTVNGTAVAVGDTTVYVASTNGFPSTGIMGIGANKITYTGKTTTTFTGCSGVTVAAGTATNVYPWVFEISTTESGSSPTWSVMTPGTEYSLDKDSGKVHVYRDDIVLEQFVSATPPKDIPDRFRASYIAGHNTVPNEIKKVVLMMASQDLVHSTFNRTQLDGINHAGRYPDINKEYIKTVLDENTSWRTKNI